VLFYHSVNGKEVIGIARVIKEKYPDPTTDDDRWVVVDVEPVRALKRPVSLEEIKLEPGLSEISLVKQGRLSVMPLKPEEFNIILELSEN